MESRTLILHLLLGARAGSGVDGDAESSALSVRELLGACALFGHAPSTVRVVLARAAATGWLIAPRRGAYALGPLARPLADEADRWRRMAAQLEDGLDDWHGDWIAVHAGAVPRSDRAALQRRERALTLLGLAEFERGLHLRPANLVGGADALRSRLQALMPAGANAGTVFRLDTLSAADAERARTLWDTARLDAAYRATTAELGAWLDAAHALPLERAARESFELGHRAIRQLVFDPWLPAPLVDVAARQRFVAAVSRHDAAGRDIWQRYLAALRPPGALQRTPTLASQPLQETAR